MKGTQSMGLDAPSQSGPEVLEDSWRAAGLQVCAVKLKKLSTEDGGCSIHGG